MASDHARQAANVGEGSGAGAAAGGQHSGVRHREVVLQPAGGRGWTLSFGWKKGKHAMIDEWLLWVVWVAKQEQKLTRHPDDAHSLHLA